jgi:hypothetical protein
MRSGRDAASSVTTLVTQYLLGVHAPSRRSRFCGLCFVASGAHGAGDIGNRRVRKFLLQSLDRWRRRLAQNRKDMGSHSTGCARRRPVLGEKLAAFHSGEDIAQSNVAGGPRQFEAAARTEPSTDQSSRCHQRKQAANHDWIGARAIRDILRTHGLSWAGGQRGQQVNANGKSGARSHPSTLAQHRPGLQKAARRQAQLTVSAL